MGGGRAGGKGGSIHFYLEAGPKQTEVKMLLLLPYVPAGIMGSK